ncbi:hypothetical protein DL96DRAFT_1589834 [Flagelloscypha sp. PMI_526]|nr:hypothetical protein DL96DRAFT_1589834 [Flagelloscypha sp. PMI_526]
MFPSDIFYEITEYLPLSSLKAYSLANSSFHDIAQPKLFFHFTISLYAETNWQQKCHWFLYDPRGAVLCKEVKSLALTAAEFVDLMNRDAKEVVELIKLFSPRLRTLEFRGERRHVTLNRILWNGLLLYVLPHIRRLAIWDPSIPLFPVVGCCPELRVLEHRVSPPRREASFESDVNLPYNEPPLERIKILVIDGEFPSFPQRTSLKELYLNFTRSPSSGWRPSSSFFDQLQPFTLLVDLTLEIFIYNHFARPGASKNVIIPFNAFPHLQRVAFEIGSPQMNFWDRFFSWICEQLTSSDLPSALQNIHFTFSHPILKTPHSNQAIHRTSQVLPDFNRLAAGSSLHLRFAVQTKFKNDGRYFEGEEWGYDLSVALLKHWLASWVEAGKLDVWREWLTK